MFHTLFTAAAAVVKHSPSGPCSDWSALIRTRSGLYRVGVRDRVRRKCQNVCDW